MDTYNIILSQRATRDIYDVIIYIINELKAPEAAKEIAIKFDEYIESLSEMPKRFALVNDKKLSLKGIRIAMVENYYIFYKVNDNLMTVEIITVQYARRDWKKLL